MQHGKPHHLEPLGVRIVGTRKAGAHHPAVSLG